MGSLPPSELWGPWLCYLPHDTYRLLSDAGTPEALDAGILFTEALNPKAACLVEADSIPIGLGLHH